MMTTDPRAEMVSTATDLEPNFAQYVNGPGKYEHSDDRVLTAALREISLHGFADADIRTADGHVAQIGPFLLFTSEQGFCTHELCASEGEAILRIDELVEEEPECSES